MKPEPVAVHDARYQELIDSLPEIVFEVSTDGRVTFANQAAYQALGQSPDVLQQGFNAFDMLIPEDRERAKRNFGEVMSGKALGGMEYTARRRDGTRFPVLVHTCAIMHEGRPVGIRGVGFDTTRLKQAEAALRASEQEFRSVFEDAPIGIYRTTPSGRILMANRRLVQLLGYASVEELMARNLEKEGFGPSYPRSWFKELIAREGEIRNLEASWYRRDGTVVFLRENARVIRDDKGAISFYEGTVEDISERKQTEAALEQQQTLIRRIMDTSPAGILVMDSNQQVTFANARAERVLGLKKTASGAGYELPDWKPATDGTKTQEPENPMEWVLATGRPVHDSELTLQWPDGRVRFIALSGAPILDEGGQVSQAVFAVSDVTERRLIEAALASTRTRLEHLLTSSPTVIYSRGLRGLGQDANLESEGADFTFVSDNVRAQLGYEPQAFLAQPAFWLSHVHPEDSTKTAARLQRVVREGTRVMEYRFRHKDGSYRWLRDELRVVPDASGTPIELVGSWVDITEAKLTEEALKASEARARAFAQAIPDMLFRVARDGTFLQFKGTKGTEPYVPPSEFLGRRMTEVMPPDIARTGMELVGRALTSGETQTFSYQLPMMGSLRDFEARIVASGEDEALIVVRDVTEHKRADKALEEDEERYRVLTEETMIGIYIAVGSRFVFVNRMMEKMTGYSRAELLALDSGALTLPEELAAIRARKPRREPGEADEYAMRLRRKDGSVTTIQVRTRPITYRGQTAYLGNFIDVEEVKRLEQAMREARNEER